MGQGNPIETQFAGDTKGIYAEAHATGPRLTTSVPEVLRAPPPLTSGASGKREIGSAHRARNGFVVLER
jgi:hypothetical protein